MDYGLQIEILKEEFSDMGLLEILETITEMSGDEYDELSTKVQAAYQSTMAGFRMMFNG